MGIWSPHNAVTTTLVGPNLESQLKSWIAAGCQMTPSWSGWGSHPTWNDYLTCSKYVKCYWKHYMLWMGIWCPHHAITTRLVGPDFERQLKSVMDHCWVPNDTIMQWLRVLSLMKWFPHWKVIENFICCGWEYGAPIMLLPLHLCDPIWKVSWIHQSLLSLGAKWHHHAVVKAIILHGMISKHTPRIDKHYMLWTGIWRPHHAVTTTLVGHNLERHLKSLITAVGQCSSWGSHPTWNDSHVHSNHINSHWQT